jgi:bifunctional non-homologous end joining protein LigD
VTETVKARVATSGRLPEFVEPMKAKLVNSMSSGGDWIYEIKFDSYRALALRGGSSVSLVPTM